MISTFRNLKLLTLIFYISLNFNLYSHAHTKGIFSTEEDALSRSQELGCKGTHKNRDKWMPCENEKDLHKYLRR